MEALLQSIQFETSVLVTCAVVMVLCSIAILIVEIIRNVMLSKLEREDEQIEFLLELYEDANRRIENLEYKQR